MGLFEAIYVDIKKTGSGVAKAIFFIIVFALFLLITVIGHMVISIGRLMEKLGLGFIGNFLNWLAYTVLFPGFDADCYPLSDPDAWLGYLSIIFVSAVVCFIIAFKTCQTLKGWIILYLILITISLILWGHVLDPAGFHS